MILGIDEVGRGPWAGPLVVGAVVLGDVEIEGLRDSKKLSAIKRADLARRIHSHAQAVGLGWVQADELDTLGISQSLVVATKRAVGQIQVPYHEIIIDGTVNFLQNTHKGPYVTVLKKADDLIASVSAASIVAKVARDEYMLEQASIYPDYGFESHVGYGTAKHRAAIERYGVTPLHRLSFAPLAKYRQDAAEQATDQQTRETSKQRGDKAEDATARYLELQGHTIMARNWRTRRCEVDIISTRNDTYYFTEVKYRRTANQGGGMAAITPSKLKQMKFAAEYYALKNQLTGRSLILAAAEVSGPDYTLMDWLEIK